MPRWRQMQPHIFSTGDVSLWQTSHFMDDLYIQLTQLRSTIKAHSKLTMKIGNLERLSPNPPKLPASPFPLLRLPPELIIQVTSHLPFTTYLCLRVSSSYFHSLLSPRPFPISTVLPHTELFQLELLLATQQIPNYPPPNPADQHDADLCSKGMHNRRYGCACCGLLRACWMFESDFTHTDKRYRAGGDKSTSRFCLACAQVSWETSCNALVGNERKGRGRRRCRHRYLNGRMWSESSFFDYDLHIPLPATLEERGRVYPSVGADRPFMS